MCWNKALTFGVGSIKLRFRAIVFTQYMHANMFAIQMLLHFSQIAPRVLHFSAFHYYNKLVSTVTYVRAKQYNTYVLLFSFHSILSLLESHLSVVPSLI